VGITSIPQRIRSVQRLPQIIGVLAKYGFGDVVSRVGIDSVVHQLKSKVFKDVDPRFTSLATEARIRLALEDLGPTFVKMGQVMATRPDLIPMSLCEELRQLQDKVKPFDTEGIKAFVEAELGRPVDDMFQELDPKPLAAASIAQVHRATLKDGRKVILKIQRPNLERVIETDLAILSWLAQVADENLPELRRYDPMGLVAEFKKSLFKEIDFEIEAYHIRRFAKNFAGDEEIYVPAVIEECTTSKILCEEFIEGTPLNHPELHQKGLDLQRIARIGIRNIIQQALVHGFFHGDPHPGNIFVIGSEKVCFIDYGMMGILDQQRIDELLSFLVSILTRDLDKLLRLFYRLELINEHVDVRGLRRDVDDLIARFETVDLANLDVGKFLQSVFEVIVQHDVKVPSDLLLVGKALATIEGVGRDIYPDLNALEEIRPIILKIYLGRLADPMYHARAPRQAMDEALYLAETGPRDLRIALRKLRDGEIQSKLELLGMERALKAQAQATNRLSLSILTGILVLSSAYLFKGAELTPWIGDFPLNPVLGVIGLGLAVLYGGVLLVGFLRSGAF
jgi:ubiquinone biosynthesis protein